MKHAGDASFEQLAGLLANIRKEPALRERKPGIFYRGATAFLHFHEDAAGLFADLKIGKVFERFPVNTQAEQQALLRRVRDELAG